MEDFKSYGGGIPSYFFLLKYYAISLLVLAAIVNVYHIYVLESACPLVSASDHQQRCQSFLLIFKLCDPAIIYQVLVQQEREVEANIFLYLQLLSFIYLISVTIAMKIWLQMFNRNHILKYQQIYTEYSFMLKNIPKYITCR